MKFKIGDIIKQSNLDNSFIAKIIDIIDNDYKVLIVKNGCRTFRYDYEKQIKGLEVHMWSRWVDQRCEKTVLTINYNDYWAKLNEEAIK